MDALLIAGDIGARQVALDLTRKVNGTAGGGPGKGHGKGIAGNAAPEAGAPQKL
ncbi:hypothetical protein [Polyangium sp. 15x6]|uniref:hypothetical protein n=1 Tax=Polyangium sp. 15x6 TaxID=3042687 RepID=UPI00249C2E03|nr:hypothetical protein [Polyangium sp. 15x6]MDI3288333.1 hypothetical protein [Polyangium sp. 15x6]